MLVEFSLKVLYSTMCGKSFQIYGARIPRKGIDLRQFYLCSSPLKNAPKFLSSRPKQKKITYFPGQHSFKNPFPETTERGGVN